MGSGWLGAWRQMSLSDLAIQEVQGGGETSAGATSPQIDLCLYH